MDSFLWRATSKDMALIRKRHGGMDKQAVARTGAGSPGDRRPGQDLCGGRSGGSDALPAIRLIGGLVVGSVLFPDPPTLITDGLEISQHLKGRSMSLFPG